jgi:hypothetical protein
MLQEYSRAIQLLPLEDFLSVRAKSISELDIVHIHIFGNNFKANKTIQDSV